MNTEEKKAFFYDVGVDGLFYAEGIGNPSGKTFKYIAKITAITDLYIKGDDLWDLSGEEGDDWELLFRNTTYYTKLEKVTKEEFPEYFL